MKGIEICIVLNFVRQVPSLARTAAKGAFLLYIEKVLPFLDIFIYVFSFFDSLSFILTQITPPPWPKRATLAAEKSNKGTIYPNQSWCMSYIYPPELLWDTQEGCPDIILEVSFI